jgi:hypothetical protein
MHRHFAKVTLANFARIAEQAEYRILGRAQADAAQLIIVEPAHGPGRTPECQAKAGDADRFCVRSAHVICICRQLRRVKVAPIAALQ